MTQLANSDLEVVSTHGNGLTVETDNFFGGAGLTSDVHVDTLTLSAAGTALLVRGVVADGYIKGATVFADAHGNGKLEPGDQTATTGSKGEYYFTSAAAGPVIATGGTDVSTGLAFTGRLGAPAGSTVVTALTTLVQKIMATNGRNKAGAMAAVSTALGLPADTALTTFSPEQATLNGSPTGIAAYLANAGLFNTLALAAAAGATGDLYSKLAAQIVAHPGKAYDPTSVPALQSLGLSGVIATNTSAIASAGAALLAAKTAAAAGSPASLVAGITATETALQGKASTPRRSRQRDHRGRRERLHRG